MPADDDNTCGVCGGPVTLLGGGLCDGCAARTAEGDAALALLREQTVCTCGCPMADHENLGEDGMGCGDDSHDCLPTFPAIAKMLTDLRARIAEMEAERAAEEEVCLDGDGKPFICAECDAPMRAGEGGWGQFADGVRHAHACEARYYKRNLDAAQTCERQLLYWLARAWQSGHREGWEHGPSVAATMDALSDLLANAEVDPSTPAGKALLTETHGVAAKEPR